MENEIKEILQSMQGMAPDVFEQVIRWGIVSNGIIAVCCAILCAVGVYICMTICKKDTLDNEEKVAGCVIFGLLLGLLPAIGTLAAACEALQAWLAPYAYFIGQLSN